MAYTYIATLGIRPQAITVALDRLREQYSYESVLIAHTSLALPALGQAHEDLRKVLRKDYSSLTVRFHEITYPDGAPLSDITDQRSSEAYHRGLLMLFHEMQKQRVSMHLMLAGGRKAMSIYAMLAAAWLFEPPADRVWTVLSPEEMLKPDQFHIPAGLRNQVQIVDLPILPQRLAPGISVDALLQQQPSRKEAFLKKLTPAERHLAELLHRNPYHSNARLAEIDHKSPKTIENQLRAIYSKLRSFLVYGEDINDERQALRDIMKGE
jgi:CRISPR-associated protein (TIGR02584 family)